jgi:hypothetical protein
MCFGSLCFSVLSELLVRWDIKAFSEQRFFFSTTLLLRLFSDFSPYIAAVTHSEKIPIWPLGSSLRSPLRGLRCRKIRDVYFWKSALHIIGWGSLRIMCVALRMFISLRERLCILSSCPKSKRSSHRRDSRLFGSSRKVRVH